MKFVKSVILSMILAVSLVGVATVAESIPAVTDAVGAVVDISPDVAEASGTRVGVYWVRTYWNGNCYARVNKNLHVPVYGWKCIRANWGTNQYVGVYFSWGEGWHSHNR